jgi:hypothetical protein
MSMGYPVKNWMDEPRAWIDFESPVAGLDRYVLNGIKSEGKLSRSYCLEDRFCTPSRAM